MKMTLRRSDRADFDHLRSWLNSSDQIKIWGGSGLGFPLKRTQFDSMLKQAARFPPERLCYSLDLDERFSGHAQVVLDDDDQIARLARIIVARERRGKGYASSMLRPIIAHVFDRGFARIELNVFANNEAAISLYRSLGFIYEGRRRQAALFSNGRIDIHMMGLMKGEFRS